MEGGTLPLWVTKDKQRQKQTQRHGKQTFDYQQGKEIGRGKLGVRDLQILTSLYKTDKQVSSIWHRELYRMSCSNL